MSVSKMTASQIESANDEYAVTISRIDDIKKLHFDAQGGYGTITQQTYAKDVGVLLSERERLDRHVNKLQDLILQGEQRYGQSDVAREISRLEESIKVSTNQRVQAEIELDEARRRVASMEVRLALADVAGVEYERQTKKLLELEDEAGVQKRAAQRLDGLLNTMSRDNGRLKQVLGELWGTLCPDSSPEDHQALIKKAMSLLAELEEAKSKCHLSECKVKLSLKEFNDSLPEIGESVKE